MLSELSPSFRHCNDSYHYCCNPTALSTYMAREVVHDGRPTSLGTADKVEAIKRELYFNLPH